MWVRAAGRPSLTLLSPRPAPRAWREPVGVGQERYTTNCTKCDNFARPDPKCARPLVSIVGSNILFPKNKFHTGKKKVSCASAGSRTRINCLEGNYSNRYTTDAHVGAALQASPYKCVHSTLQCTSATTQTVHQCDGADCDTTLWKGLPACVTSVRASTICLKQGARDNGLGPSESEPLLRLGKGRAPSAA